jgi:AcrR family transcriptional regulator
MSTAKLEGSARERLLAAATELFYEEGVHTVGIDRVIERAGVAKASLYSTFGSKEALVRAYLESRAETRRQRIAQRIARYDNPRDRLLGVFDYLADAVTSPTYRGCAFANASAEGPRSETRVTQVCSDARAWFRGLLVELARDAGAVDPEQLAGQLVLLYDGAVMGSSMDRDPAAPARARAIAELLLDASTAGDAGKRRTVSRAGRRPVAR